MCLSCMSETPVRSKAGLAASPCVMVSPGRRFLSRWACLIIKDGQHGLAGLVAEVGLITLPFKAF